jgi:hypothetical protein
MLFLFQLVINKWLLSKGKIKYLIMHISYISIIHENPFQEAYTLRQLEEAVNEHLSKGYKIKDGLIITNLSNGKILFIQTVIKED